MATFPVLLNPSSVRPQRPMNFPLGAVLGVVFVACTSTTIMGGHTSQAVLTSAWVRLFGNWHLELMGAVNIVFRKVGHFIGHGLLSLVFYRAWLKPLQSRSSLKRVWWKPTASLLAVLTTLTVASLDELHQRFVPGRVGCVRDVLIDVAGALAANALFLTIVTRQKPQLVRTVRRVSTMPLPLRNAA